MNGIGNQGNGNRAAAQRGFGLIELMVALLLGVIIAGGVVQVFYSTNQAYRSQQALSRVQESGRFVLEVLKPRLRPAGRVNFCVANLNVNQVLNTASAGYFAAIHNPNVPIVGFEYDGTNEGDAYALPELALGEVAGGDYNSNFGLPVPQDVIDRAVPGSDVLIIKYSDPIDRLTACGYNAGTADLALNMGVACGATPPAPYSQNQLDAIYPEGSLVLVTDCNTGGDLFQRTNDGSPVFSLDDGGPVPGNIAAGLSRNYNDEAQVLPFHSVLFYVGIGASGQPALFQMDFGGDGVPEELIEGVENIQVMYGELDIFGNVNYLEADAVVTPGNIVSIRVSLLVRSNEAADLEVDDQTYDLQGTIVDPIDDSRLRQVFSTTVAVRNRVNVI
ncbi:MAG: PilW family protein [Xanthomonadales bacterium]|nr:PilW family protein [Xanthomonadales bacterium]